MDLGSSICTKRAPKCGDCPLNQHCKSAFRVARPSRPRSSNERQFFGAPQRIWRGRVLKEIAAKPTAVRTIVARLAKQYQIKEANFETLIETICQKLIAEGLVTKSKHGTLRLAD
jgi:adenine-specific DNA glycosylase